MSNSEQEQVEIETISLEHAIGMGQALARLNENEDFIKVITDGYLREKALASVSLLGVPQIKDQGHRPAVVEDLISISCLKYYFKVIEHEYEGAIDPILSDDEQAAVDGVE